MSTGFDGDHFAEGGSGPESEDEPRVVVRDKRRIDPLSGAVREPDSAASAVGEATGPPVVSAPVASAPVADERVAELTETLQRLKAEYDNYRRRAERDRVALADIATGATLAALLPVLDDIERARAHGDLTGAFGSVGDALTAVTGKLGLEPYAAKGDEFDPQVHEAVMQAMPAAGVEHAVVADVFRQGYRHAGRVLRAAQVSVSEPGGPDALDDLEGNAESGEEARPQA